MGNVGLGWLGLTSCSHLRLLLAAIRTPFRVSLRQRDPDSWTASHVLMEADISQRKIPIGRIKGLPTIIQPIGKTVLAHCQFMASLAFLRYPCSIQTRLTIQIEKGRSKIERWFLTLDRGCPTNLARPHVRYWQDAREAAEKHVDVLLTIPQLRARDRTLDHIRLSPAIFRYRHKG